MKVLGNTVALIVAVSLMGGLILAQRDYQNSWRDRGLTQMPAINATNPAAPAPADQYNVVMK